MIHQLAAFIIEYSERSETAIAEELGRAERAVDRAIAITRGRTGHYFETKARLLALRGDYTSARIAIGQAIELEPRETVDYHRRLTEYQATRVRIDLLQQRSRWNNQQERNRRELEQFKAQQLQLLGLLAAVVAFVATTGNIASKSGATEGLLLIQAMAGALIVVFASFSLVSTRSIWRIACMYAVGVLMLAAPYVLER